ncbi:MAG: hypothetical protein KAT71_06600 [Gammaproteobacteria bacterium]|nr:hypothetical protein [Gammaproteobacteria bacterium]
MPGKKRKGSLPEDPRAPKKTKTTSKTSLLSNNNTATIIAGLRTQEKKRKSRRPNQYCSPERISAVMLTPHGSKAITTPGGSILHKYGVEINIESSSPEQRPKTDTIIIFNNQIPSNPSISPEVQIDTTTTESTHLVHSSANRVFSTRITQQIVATCKKRGRPKTSQHTVMGNTSAHNYLAVTDLQTFEQYEQLAQKYNISFEWLHIIACVFNLDPQKQENFIAGTRKANIIMLAVEIAVRDLVRDGEIKWANIEANISYKPYYKNGIIIGYTHEAKSITYVVSFTNSSQETKKVSIDFDPLETHRASTGANRALRELVKIFFSLAGVEASDTFFVKLDEEADLRLDSEFQDDKSQPIARRLFFAPDPDQTLTPPEPDTTAMALDPPHPPLAPLIAACA